MGLKKPLIWNRMSYSVAQSDYLAATKQGLEFWLQKSGFRWMKEGEANTKYYHSIVNERRRRKTIRTVE